MRAVVIGSGVAGPATALALHRVGVEAVVLEAHPRPSGEVGSYLAVSPNGLSALDALGVLGAVRDVAVPTPGSVLLGATGRVLGRTSFGRPLDDGTPALTLKRTRLAAVLAEQAEARGIEVRHDARVSGLRRSATGTVVTLASGEELEAELVVGADGVHSVVRRHLDPAAPAARYVGLTNFGGITRAPDLAATLEPGRWAFTFGHRAFSGLVPTPGGDVIWFVNLPRPLITPEERAATSEEEWRRVLVEAVADDAGCAAEAIERGRFELTADNTHDLGHVPVWHDGSAVVIGDAAHAPAPSSGQGASMALEDAVALAVAVRDARSVAEALAAYEAARRPRVEKIVAVGARSSSAKMPGRLSRPIVEAMMKVVFRTVASDARAAWMSDYRASFDAGSPARVSGARGAGGAAR